MRVRGECDMSFKLESAITFLYFDDLASAKRFFSEALGLEAAYDPGWECV
jgi:hypothetical protein